MLIGWLGGCIGEMSGAPLGQYAVLASVTFPAHSISGLADLVRPG